MTTYPDDGMCHETAGFLFSHRCDRFSVEKCVRCGKPVCQDHGHPVDDGTVCTTCAKREVKPDSPMDPQGDPQAGAAKSPQIAPGNVASRPYHNDPYFYGTYWYPGYGYGHGYGFDSSGHSSGAVRGGDSAGGAGAAGAGFDANDFTEGDAESLRNEGDGDFESTMGES